MWYSEISPALVGLRICLCSTVLCAAAAQASLGGDQSSVQADLAELQGVVTTTVQADYSLMEINTDSGMRVREFADRSGKIFAVSWSGPAAPDLRQLLGAHFDAYAHALTQLQHPGLQRSVRIESGGLVVESGGHLRAYAGRAFLAGQLPAGVALTDLR